MVCILSFFVDLIWNEQEFASVNKNVHQNKAQHQPPVTNTLIDILSHSIGMRHSI